MNFVAISDTHGDHWGVNLPVADVVVHAGDISSVGTPKQVMAFLDWFSSLPHPYKIFIAGNHDYFFETNRPEVVAAVVPDNVIYLNDSGIEIEGISIWGSPVQPWFMDWAFNRKRGAEIKKHWDLIPSGTDLLVTHGPAYGILDATVRGEMVGCKQLSVKIAEVKPRVHVCGHIHEARGQQELDGTHYINASVLDHKYRMAFDPICFTL